MGSHIFEREAEDLETAIMHARDRVARYERNGAYRMAEDESARIHFMEQLLTEMRGMAAEPWPKPRPIDTAALRQAIRNGEVDGVFRTAAAGTL